MDYTAEKNARMSTKKLWLFLYLTACWKRNHVTRPSFERISAEIKSLQCSEFCSSTSHEDFKTMQSMWRGEIQQKFVELKKMQIVSVCVCVCVWGGGGGGGGGGERERIGLDYRDCHIFKGRLISSTLFGKRGFINKFSWFGKAASFCGPLVMVVSSL